MMSEHKRDNQTTPVAVAGRQTPQDQDLRMLSSSPMSDSEMRSSGQIQQVQGQGQLSQLNNVLNYPGFFVTATNQGRPQSGALTVQQNQINLAAEQNLQNALKLSVEMQARQVKRSTAVVVGSLRSITPDALCTEREEYQRSAEDMVQTLQCDKNNIVSNRFSLTTAISTFQIYGAKLDSFVTFLRRSENIAWIRDSLAHTQSDLNILRAFDALKIFSPQAKEIYEILLTESTNLHQKLTASLSNQSANESANEQDAASLNTDFKTLCQTQRNMEETLYIIELNLKKYRDFLEEDDVSLGCIRKDIDGSFFDRRLACFVFDVIIVYVYCYAVYNLSYTFNFFGFDFLNLALNFIKHLIGLILFGLITYSVPWIWRKEREIEKAWTKAEAKFKRGRKKMDEIEADNKMKADQQQVHTIVSAGLPTIQIAGTVPVQQFVTR